MKESGLAYPVNGFSIALVCLQLLWPFHAIGQTSNNLADIIASHLSGTPYTASVAYYNGVTHQQFEYHADRPYNAASTIKLPVFVVMETYFETGDLDPNATVTLQAQHRQPGSGVLHRTPNGTPITLRRLTHLMMQESDNTATTMLIDVIGMKRINNALDGFGLFNTQLNTSQLISGWPINTTTASDMAALLKKMLHNELISSDRDTLLLGTMAGNNYTWGIPKYLDCTVANKTGTLANVALDAAVVYESKQPYVLAIFLEGPRAMSAGREQVARLAKAVHDWHVRMQ